MKKIFLLVLLLSVCVPGCKKKNTSNTKYRKVENVNKANGGKTFSEDADEFVLEDEAGFNVFDDENKKQIDENKDIAWDEVDNEGDKFDRVQFDYDKSNIKPNEQEKVQRNAKKILPRLKKDENSKVIVKGHACKLAKNKEHNYVVSQERAENERNEYVKLGVPEEKIKAVGYGATNLLTDEDGMEAQAVNRRAETVVTQ